MKAWMEAITPQPDDAKENVTKYTKYICQLDCKNYTVCREKLKQDLQPLLPLLLGQCDFAL